MRHWAKLHSGSTHRTPHGRLALGQPHRGAGCLASALIQKGIMADRQQGLLAGVSPWTVHNPVTSQTPKSESCEEHHTACSHLEPSLAARPGHVCPVKRHMAFREETSTCCHFPQSHWRFPLWHRFQQSQFGWWSRALRSIQNRCCHVRDINSVAPKRGQMEFEDYNYSSNIV